MGSKFLPNPLGIHIVKVFSDNGLTHVTKQAFVENTIRIGECPIPTLGSLPEM